MTRITGPSDHSPADLLAIAADLRASDRPERDRLALDRIAAELEEMAAARARTAPLAPEMLTLSEQQSLQRSADETIAYAESAFRRTQAGAEFPDR